MKNKKFLLVAFIAGFMAMSASAFAAEPATEPEDSYESRSVEVVEALPEDSEEVIMLEITESGIQLADGQNVNDSEIVIANANNDDGIMPLSEIRGYAAKYTDPSKGSFTINASGSSSTGYMQVAARNFANSPTITVVLYRPDGSYAGQVYLSGNGTKSISFSNAVAGTYTAVYAVEGTAGGWLDLWLSW